MEKSIKEKSEKNIKKGRAARNKGKRGERAVANMFTARGFESKRGVQYKGGIGSPDIICDMLKDIFLFEVKWVEQLNLDKAYNQAKKDAGLSLCPVVIHKVSKSEWKATLNLTYFIDILQTAFDNKDGMNILYDKIKRVQRHDTEQEGSSSDSTGEEFL